MPRMATRRAGTTHRAQKRASKGRSFLLFLGASLLAGLLIAGLAVPFAALAGVSATVIEDSVDALPAYLDTPPEAERTTIYLADLTVLAQLYDENRVVLEDIDDISPIMRWAQIDIEDERFYEHGAMDLKGTVRALLSNIAGGATQGGSSITQQYVKLVRIEDAVAKDDQEGVAAAQAVTLSRKIEEMRYAIAIERRLDKDDILLNYLNIAYYGDQAYGIEAAARHYYGISAKDLNLEQSAMLAGIVQNPNLNPIDNPEDAQEKRDLVIDAMMKNGHIEQFIIDHLVNPVECAGDDLSSVAGQQACDRKTKGKTAAELADEVAADIKSRPFDASGVTLSQSGCVGTRYSIPCHYIEELLYEDTSFGKTRAERERTIQRGGYKVFTTLDPAYQDPAQAAVTAFALPTDPVIVTINIVEPGTGRIFAMAQNQYEYGTDLAQGQTMWVHSVSSKYGGSQGFQAGSTFKTFTAAAALDQGFPPTYKIASPSSINLTGKKFTDCDGNANAIPITGSWVVSGGGGTIDMYTAAAQSVNTYFAQLILRVGPCAVTKIAKAAGVELANGSDIVFGDPEKVADLRAKAEQAAAEGNEIMEGEYLAEAEDYSGFSEKPSFTLGSANVTPISMAGAFATYGARGKACTPSIIQEIHSRDDDMIKNFNLGVDNCTEGAIRTEVMDGLNNVLRGVTFNGLGSSVIIDGRDQGTKTGTTEYNDNVWVVTYTPTISVAANVSVNTDPYGPIRSFWDTNGDGILQDWEKNMSYRTLPSGRTLQGWSWLDPPIVINAALAPVKDRFAAESFVAPTAEILRGTPVTVPSCSGTVSQMEACYEAAGFSIGKADVYNDSPAGTFLSVSCEPYRGGLCNFLYSKGPAPAPDPDPSESAGGEAPTDEVP
jgi:membrane peptidoglycan carboxypeptidase